MLQLESSDQKPSSLGGGAAWAQVAHRGVSILGYFQGFIRQSHCNLSESCKKSCFKWEIRGEVSRVPLQTTFLWFSDIWTYEPCHCASDLNVQSIPLPYLEVKFRQVLCLLFCSPQCSTCMGDWSLCPSPGLCALKQVSLTERLPQSKVCCLCKAHPLQSSRWYLWSWGLTLQMQLNTNHRYIVGAIFASEH